MISSSPLLTVFSHPSKPASVPISSTSNPGVSTLTKTMKMNPRVLSFTTLFLMINLLLTPVSAQSDQQPTFTADLYPRNNVGSASYLEVKVSNPPASIPDASTIRITLPPEIKIHGNDFVASCVSGMSKTNTKVSVLGSSMLVLTNGGPYDSAEMYCHILGVNIYTSYFAATQNITDSFALRIEHSVDTFAELFYTPTILPALLPDATLELSNSSPLAKTSLKLTFTAPTLLPKSFVIVMKVGPSSQDSDSDSNIMLFSDVRACRVTSSNNDTTISTRFPCSSTAAGIIEISYRTSQPASAGSILTVEIGHVTTTLYEVEASLPMEIYIQTDGRQATIAETTILSVTCILKASIASKIRSTK